jgi:hypothetical protein
MVDVWFATSQPTQPAAPSLADTMASFMATSGTSTATASAADPKASSSPAPVLMAAIPSSQNGLVDAMRPFDANGQHTLTGSAPSLAVPTTLAQNPTPNLAGGTLASLSG